MYDGFRPSLGGQQLFCLRGTFDLLVFSCVAAIFFFRSMDPDVVDDGRGLQDLLILLLKPFHPAHEPSVFIHLGEMLDPSGISGVVPDHGQQETVCFSRPIRRTFQLPVVRLLPYMLFHDLLCVYTAHGFIKPLGLHR